MFLLTPCTMELKFGMPTVLLSFFLLRELACQIEAENRKFGFAAGIRGLCCYGGTPKGPMIRGLRGFQPPHVVTATPGRCTFVPRLAALCRCPKYQQQNKCNGIMTVFHCFFGVWTAERLVLEF